MRLIALFLGLSILGGGVGYAQGVCSIGSTDVLKIDLIRLGTENVDDRGTIVPRIYGDIGVNNRNVGRFYENPQLKIPAGSYNGALRYVSNHDFVQSSCGEMSRVGDFLLEVANVRGPDGKSRTNILFHPGALPSHSKGCVLFGARKFDNNGKPLPLDPTNPLVIIRHEFYGTDNPVSCPDKAIVISIQDK